MPSALEPSHPVIPETVSHALATLGEVQFITGPPRDTAASRLHVAPFDDLLLLFASPGSRTLENVERTPVSEVLAQNRDASIQLRMTGRAVYAGAVNAHPRRLELQHWLPEGTPGVQLRAVEFVPDYIEFAQGPEEARNRYQGHPPGTAVPGVGTRWLYAAFEGTWPFALAALVVTWGWFTWWGESIPGRILPFAWSALAALAILAGCRLVHRSAMLHRWQEGRASRSAAGVLGLGWVSCREARLAGIGLLGVGAISVLGIGVIWGLAVFVLLLVTSQLWWMVPAMGIQILDREERKAP